MKKNLSLLSLVFGFTFISIYTHAQQRERMVAWTYFRGDTGVYTPADSVTYSYSGSRAIDSIWGSYWAFDTLYDWLYNAHTGYILGELQTEVWSPANKLLADTIWRWDTVSRGFIYYEYGGYVYYSSNDSVTTIYQLYDSTLNSWYNSSLWTKVYNGDFYLTNNTSYSWSSGRWDTSIVYSVTYNAANQVLTSTTYWHSLVINTTSRNSYTYDSLGRLSTTTLQSLPPDTSIWQNVSRTVNTYDSLNNVSSALTQSWKNSAWDTSTISYYTYDANHNLLGYFVQVLDTTDSWINSEKYIFTYDSYNMMTSSTLFDWDSTGAWSPQEGDEMYHYYYELYSLPTGIVTIAPAGDAHIYPVPAADMLSVDIQWVEAQDADITIYDMSGRRCGEWKTGCTASYHGYVPVAALQAGMYTMQIHGASGTITRSFNIMK